jgi:hypothetical protein
MQPVLPSFQLPEHLETGKATLVTFCVVNDLVQAFPGATCEWRLEGVTGDLASAAFPMDIPSDGVSTEAKLTLPSLAPGNYKLLVAITSSRKVLGENLYKLSIK